MGLREICDSARQFLPSRRELFRFPTKYHVDAQGNLLGDKTNNALEETTLPRPPTIPQYIHANTTNSPQILLDLPTEILDTILSHLDTIDWRALRETHSVFKSSAQSLLYRQLEFCDFRPSTDRISKLDAFFRLMASQPHIGHHVLEVKLRSLMDPTRQEDIAEFLPKMLSTLGNLKSVTLRFNVVKFIMKQSIRNAMATLSKGLQGINVGKLIIEFDFASTAITDGLTSLPITDIVYTKQYNEWSGNEPGWNIQPWLNGLVPYTSLRCLKLGCLEVGTAEMSFICTTFPQLTELFVNVSCSASAAQIVAELEPVRKQLRALSLRRLYGRACVEDHANRIDVQAFTALRYLELDVDFLTTPDVIRHNTELAHNKYGLFPFIEAGSSIGDHVPKQLRDLIVVSNVRGGLLSKDAQGVSKTVSDVGFLWLVNYFDHTFERCRVVLAENPYVAAGEHLGSRSDVDKAQVEKYELSRERMEAMRRCGVELEIWVQKIEKSADESAARGLSQFY